jgi:transcription elongation factor SPT5
MTDNPQPHISEVPSAEPNKDQETVLHEEKKEEAEVQTPRLEEEKNSGEEEVHVKKKHKHHHHEKKRAKKVKRDVDRFIDDVAVSSDEESVSSDPEAEINEQQQKEFYKEYDARKERPHYAIEKVLRGGDEAEYLVDLERNNQQPTELLTSKNTELYKEIHLPSVKDPSLWLVKCKKGMEKLASLSLMQKSFVKFQEKDPLLILSVTSLSYLHGYIYVEAFKEAHVRQAISGLHCLGNKLSLVPVKEMADIYTLAKAKKNEVF